MSLPTKNLFNCLHSVVYGLNEISGDRGTIVSPLHPNRYFASPDHPPISWRITVDEGSAILVRFLTFELDQSSYGDGDCLSTLRVGQNRE